MKMLHALALFGVLTGFSVAQAEVIEYSIDIAERTVNFTGREVTALTVGGGIPGPTIEVREGDILRVTFTNKMDVESSIHWHGVLLPNDQDGVPYLTTQPIAAHSSFTYEYPVIHSGTYWYHSHTGLQEQRGVYGSIVFHPKKENRDYDQDLVMVLSDWTDENPNQVMRNLKRDGDYYALKKDSVQSWDRVLEHGWQAVKNRMDGSLSRMGPMDISDVGYDLFLINGKRVSEHQVKPGEKVRLRIINAAASSYFNVEFAGGPMTVIAADGVDVKPFRVTRLRTAIAETWDVIVEVPDGGAYEFRATSEDGTGYASSFLGKGQKVAAPDVPKPNPYLMSHGDHGAMSHGDMDHGQMDHSQMDHGSMEMAEPVISYLTDYSPLEGLEDTTLKNTGPMREVNLSLTGNMEDYVWSFDNKVLSAADRILIRKGERVRFILKNETMMHHPIHLHGHFFRVLNGKGDKSPMKHTVNVPPMATVVIEFDANEEKDWFFHCHNLYHMKSGMSRVVSYEDSSRMTEEILRKISGDRHWYSFADLSAQSYVASGKVWTRDSYNMVSAMIEADYDSAYEGEVAYSRTINRFLKLYAGGWFEREEEDGTWHDRNVAMAGVRYVLPLLIEADLRVDSKGHVRFGLESELQLTSRLSFEWNWNTDDEWETVLEYEISKRFSLVGGHMSRFGTGGGVLVKF
ncbi:multicopper oxidase domain-containing protein [Emcibacter sp.]|uniref:multicopper oxidase domain-containing protein n=1 Tax=Emcibacter sp. TaxID=1979954 RepID=UPI002AA909DE|nr:multicopper oxidase domain-containing protein [Emcibacter sp.]